MTTLIKSSAVFLVLAATLCINAEDNFVVRSGFDYSYVYSLLLALFCSSMMAYRNVFILMAAMVFSLNANMPVDFDLNLGLDRDMYGGAMLALVFQPLLGRFLG
ncbi:MAG: hypothetical protein ABGY96_14780 [bacterium]|nr:hypothetical protein [Gammaproteobacteria bacterium]HIL97321.1 hypothetical protein [Pseudomonadales bacterium]